MVRRSASAKDLSSSQSSHRSSFRVENTVKTLFSFLNYRIMSIASVYCPYCGLPNWKKVQQVLNDTRRFLIVNLCQCENCSKMFYMCRTRISTFTVKLDDISQEELLQEERRARGKKTSRKGKKSVRTAQQETQQKRETREQTSSNVESQSPESEKSMQNVEKKS